jgi:gas vesicle protein
MNVNTMNFTGRIRENPPLAGTLARMKRDAAQAKAMALALESELLLTEDERKAAEAEGKSLEDVAKTNHRLLARGSEAIQARIQKLIQEAEDAAKAASTEEVSVVVDLERERVRLELDQWVSYLRNGLNRYSRRIPGPKSTH